MSLGFKMLREKSGIKKQDLAERLNVDYRTVSNWEKENGTIPSLAVASEIAKIMGVSSYEVFRAFMYPVVKDGDSINSESYSRLENFPQGDISPKQFFKYLFYGSAGDETLKAGIIQYNSHLFYFDVAEPISCDFSSEIKTCGKPVEAGGVSLIPVEFCDSEGAREFFEHPYCGFFVADTNMNIIVFSEDNVQSCRFVSNTCGNITYEIILNVAVFPEMEQKIVTEGRCPVRLTLLDYRHNELIATKYDYGWIARYQFAFNRENVIGQFIKTVRTSLGLSQSDFADGIIMPYNGPYYCSEITNKTVNKWETGTANPSLWQLFLLGESYDFSVKKLLDQYDNGWFVKSAVSSSNPSYDIGLNYLFARSTDLSYWVDFVICFKLAKRSISGFLNNDKVLGEASVGDCTYTVVNILPSKMDVTVELKNSSKFVIPTRQMRIVEAKNTLNNLLYEFQIVFGEDVCSTMKLSLSFFAEGDPD